MGIKNTRANGYGHPHAKLRKRWVRIVAQGGVRCARGADCLFADGDRGGLIHPGEPWDLGHVDGERFEYSGPEHRRCNRATAGRKPESPRSREW